MNIEITDANGCPLGVEEDNGEVWCRVAEITCVKLLDNEIPKKCPLRAESVNVSIQKGKV